MPTPKTISEIKSNLLRPALTSHYEVTVSPPPGTVMDWWKKTGRQGKLNLQCSEASLPGSQLSTIDITNNFHGVTEKHVNRRIFDDRLDLTFYVDAGDYTAIRFFEYWVDYITNASEIPENLVENLPPTKSASNYFYRMRYPRGDGKSGKNGYISPQGLSITKFEKDYNKGKVLQYKFINSFPLQINSIPVSYDTSDLLKCNVSMTYIRYIVNYTFPPTASSPVPRPSTILDQATQNTFGKTVMDRVGAALPQGASDLIGTLSNFA